MTYLESLASEIRAAVPGDLLPDGPVDDLFTVYAVLLLAKGDSVTGEDVHNAWVAWMLTQNKMHESMVPFSSLPANVRDEDSPYVRAIRSVVRTRPNTQDDET
jgi:hypothetical protein